MGVIEGGVVIHDGVPRHINPFGKIRRVRSTGTIAAAIAAAAAGDVIYIEEGDYDEQVSITKDNLTLVGIGGRGAVAIAPSGANKTAITIDGSGAGGRVEEVTLINVGGEGDGTGAGLHVKSDTRRIRAYGCKFEGGTSAVKLESDATGSVGDVILDDCELAWATDLLRLTVSGAGDPVTNVQVRRCLFHNMAANGVIGITVHTTGFQMHDCVMDREEDGTAPTGKYIDLAVASSSGIITRCSFPHATNASAVLSIAAGILWVANYTEAGVTAARPS